MFVNRYIYTYILTKMEFYHNAVLPCLLDFSSRGGVEEASFYVALADLDLVLLPQSDLILSLLDARITDVLPCLACSQPFLKKHNIGAGKTVQLLRALASLVSSEEP